MTKKQHKRNWNEQIERKNKLTNKQVAQWEQPFVYKLVQTNNNDWKSQLWKRDKHGSVKTQTEEL